MALLQNVTCAIGHHVQFTFTHMIRLCIMHTLFCHFVIDVLISIVIIASSSSVKVQAFLVFYEMSIPMSSGKPFTNVEHIDIHKKLLLTSVGHNNDISKKVKKEDVNPNLNVQGFAKA